MSDSGGSEEHGFGHIPMNCQTLVLHRCETRVDVTLAKFWARSGMKTIARLYQLTFWT
jgi:hypothetical protein